jgi:Predicted transcriptional regulators
MEFGYRLYILRKDRCLSQKEFAEFLNISQPSMSAYESGRIIPTLESMMGIAQKCSISLDWLCGLTQTPKVIIINELLEDIKTAFVLYGKEGRAACIDTDAVIEHLLSVQNFIREAREQDEGVNKLSLEKRVYQPSKSESKTKRAQKLLMDILSIDSRPQSLILEEALKLGISKRTLEIAKVNLGVKSYKNDVWYWELKK